MTAHVPRVGGGERTLSNFTGVIQLEYVKIGVHIWVSVLIMGTLWRLATYHALASTNSTINHAGKAMAVQY